MQRLAPPISGPLVCASTANIACDLREQAGLVPWTHSAHAISSSLATTGAIIGMTGLTLAAHRHRIWPLLARTGPTLVVLELAATLWTPAAVATFTTGRGTFALGIAQRLQVALIACWLVVLARSVATQRHT
ncbi:DUF998 domain-containing protein [Streptomyces sp. NPDC086796]|uniref:DUF998 domain-containing protein n=1 Tax=unclassified Streptomyces TaxID=2593676 RepID=UPI003430C79C